MTDITGREYIYGVAQDANGAPYLFMIRELVRCKDCLYFKKIVERSDSGLCHRDLVASAWQENGYCSRGEHKGSDDECV